MRYCEHCTINITTPVSHCPLCKSKTLWVDGEEVRAYPEIIHEHKEPETYRPGIAGIFRRKTTEPA